MDDLLSACREVGNGEEQVNTMASSTQPTKEATGKEKEPGVFFVRQSRTPWGAGALCAIPPTRRGKKRPGIQLYQAGKKKGERVSGLRFPPGVGRSFEEKGKGKQGRNAHKKVERKLLDRGGA